MKDEAPPLGILAGAGELPIVIAEALSEGGRAVFIVRIEGFASERLGRWNGISASLGELGRTISALRGAGCRSVVFAGKVDRPDLRTLKLDAFGQASLPGLLLAAGSGDDTLLSALARLFETEGFDPVAPLDVAAGLACATGHLAGPSPDDLIAADFAKGWRIAGLIGAEDIGQGCIVAGGLVLAVEAAEGTDEMLRRAASLPLSLRGRKGGRRGVLVKRAKPGQDRRMDLPVIGRDTVRLAAEAGLAGIGIEAGGSLVVGRESVFEAARALGLTLAGLGPDGRL